MTGPTTPMAFDPEMALLIRDTTTRLETLEGLVKTMSVRDGARAIEDVSDKIYKLKSNLVRDIDDLTQKFSSMSSAFQSSLRALDLEFTTAIVNQEKEANSIKALEEKYNLGRDAVKRLGDAIKNTSIGTAEFTDAVTDLRTGLTDLFADGAVGGRSLNAFLADFNTNLNRVQQTSRDLKATDAKSFFEGFGDYGKNVLQLLKALNPTLDIMSVGVDDLKVRVAGLTTGMLDSAGGTAEYTTTLNALRTSVMANAEELAKLYGISSKVADMQEALAQRTEPLLKVQKQAADTAKNLTSAFGGYVDKLTLASSQTNIFGTTLTNFWSTAAANANEDGFGFKKAFSSLSESIGGGLASSFFEPEKAANRLFNFLNENLVKSTFAFDKMVSDVNKSTGGFGKEFQEIAFKGGGTATPEMARLGLTVKDVGESYGALSKSISGFNLMMDGQRKLLVGQATEFKTLGLSGEAYGKLSAAFMGSVGDTAQGATESIKQLAKDAIGLGKDLGQYAQEFQGMIGKLSGYGQAATEIFKGLSGIAAATKGVLNASDLMNISDQFKTFDTAADAANKLSAAFGGVSVNALDMMRLNPQEQIMKIKEAADASGMSFDKLNIGYKRMLGEFFGGDVSKASSFFKADMSEALNMINNSITSEEELEERKKRSASAQEKMNAAIENLKIAIQPIADAVGFLAEKFSKLTSAIGVLPTFFITMTPLIFGAARAFMSFGSVAKLSTNQTLNEVKLLQAEIRYAMANMAALRSGATTELPIPPDLAAARGASGTPGPLTRTAPGFGGMGLLKGVGVMAAIGGLMYAASAIDDSRKPKPIATDDIKDGLITISKAGQTKVIGIDDQDDVSLMAAKPGGPLSKSSETNNNIANSSFNSFVSYAQNLGTSLNEYTKDITSSFISEGGSFFSNIGNNIKETFVASQEKSSFELQQISGNTIKESVAKLQESSTNVKTAERETFIKDVRESNTQLVKETKSTMPETLAITLKPTFTEGYAREMFSVGLEESRRVV
jgi:hypothetical protein